MKKAVVIGVAATALMGGTASAKETGMTCSFKMTSAPVYQTLYGPDNAPWVCSSFSKNRTFRPVYGSVPGKVYCIFKMRGFDIYIKTRSRNAYYGRFVCTYISKSLGKDWQRVL